MPEGFWHVAKTLVTFAAPTRTNQRNAARTAPPSWDFSRRSDRTFSAIATPIGEAAVEIGCRVSLYNHGGWFGEPENQIAVIRELGLDNGLRGVLNSLRPTAAETGDAETGSAGVGADNGEAGDASEIPDLGAILERARRDGDAGRGLAVFASAQFACLNCHQVAGHGGRVGPDAV